ncbi:Site-specific recombinase XerD [uncultured Blautia sp.]|nr:hypothetical protein [uncultured Blautia sp.]SCI14207.1 Site-specific recombinase XerD [uncultured Blautia sp.]
MAEKKTLRNAKGEGSFKVNADGTVTHRKSVGFKANGRRKVITVTAKNKSACIREMKKKENEWNNIKNGLHIDSTDTVVSLCYRHLEYQVLNNDLKGKSIDRRECTIENQISGYDLGYLQAQQVTPIDIETHVKLLISENKVGASSIGKVVDVLNAAYEWAIRQGDMQQNPVRLVKTELSKKLKKLSVKGADEADVVALSDEEIKLFEREATELHANGHEKYPAGMYCLLLLHTGMRVGEMIALRWRDWKGDYLVIEKSVSTAKNRNKKSEDENNYISLEDNKLVTIMQFTELEGGTKKFLTEFMSALLWQSVKDGGNSADLHSVDYILYDEFQNVALGKGSTLDAMLREGRKCGLGVWLATQILSNYKPEQIDTLQQVDTMLLFHPSERSMKGIAQLIDCEAWESCRSALSDLQKGQAILKGKYSVNHNSKIWDIPIICAVDSKSSN